LSRCQFWYPERGAAMSSSCDKNSYFFIFDTLLMRCLGALKDFVVYSTMWLQVKKRMRSLRYCAWF